MSFLLSRFPNGYERVAFLLISHPVAGILHVQILISHYPMPIGERFADGMSPIAHEPFPVTQLKTSLDVDCYPWLDWVHGGLQFQVVHHLFPMLPRHSLRGLIPVVEEFAKQHSLAYQSATFFEANSRVLHTLKETADGVSPYIIDLLNCQG